MCTALQQHFTQIERLNDERISRNPLTPWSKKYGFRFAYFRKTRDRSKLFFSYIIGFQLKFLSNLLGSADNSAKSASRPSVQYSVAVNGPTDRFAQNSEPLGGITWAHFVLSFTWMYNKYDNCRSKPILVHKSSLRAAKLNVASHIFVNSFYADLHDSPTDSPVPAVMDGRADVSHLERSFLLKEKRQKAIS